MYVRETPLPFRVERKLEKHFYDDSLFTLTEAESLHKAADDHSSLIDGLLLCSALLFGYPSPSELKLKMQKNVSVFVQDALKSKRSASAQQPQPSSILRKKTKYDEAKRQPAQSDGQDSDPFAPAKHHSILERHKEQVRQKELKQAIKQVCCCV